MLNKNDNNSSVLFRLFQHDKPDKIGRTLQTLGTLSFLASIVGSIVLRLWPTMDKSELLFVQILYGMFLTGWLFGIVFFIATGIHYSGKAKGHSFGRTATNMLGKTFLYIFAPAILVTLIALAFAYITSQPSIR